MGLVAVSKPRTIYDPVPISPNSRTQRALDAIKYRNAVLGKKPPPVAAVTDAELAIAEGMRREALGRGKPQLPRDMSQQGRPDVDSLAHWREIAAVCGSEGATAQQIAAEIGRSVHTVKSRLQAMHERGYVERISRGVYAYTGKTIRKE